MPLPPPDMRRRAAWPAFMWRQAEDALGYVEKYWVSVDSGLLVCAEQWKGEELTYRMTSYAVSTDRTLFGLTEFALPDGTVLHTVEE